jgi:phage gp46-like protein
VPAGFSALHEDAQAETVAEPPSISDIALVVDDYGNFDIDISDSGEVREYGFDTAIYVSLFTDARATAAQIALPQYRRGWVGNIVSPVNGRQLGGMLWLIDQRRLNQSTLNAAIDYARKALAWIVDDGLAQKIDVTGEIVPRQGVALDITITSINGSIDNRYYRLWELTGAY